MKTFTILLLLTASLILGGCEGSSPRKPEITYEIRKEVLLSTFLYEGQIFCKSPVPLLAVLQAKEATREMIFLHALKTRDCAISDIPIIVMALAEVDSVYGVWEVVMEGHIVYTFMNPGEKDEQGTSS